MPDIFKTPWYYINIDDTVEIPDVAIEEPPPEEEAPEEAPAGDGGEAEDQEGGGGERRLGTERRRTIRRAEDNLSEDTVIRLYKERLRMTKEEFFEGIEEELLAGLREQMEEIRAEAFRDELLNQRQNIGAALEALDRGLGTLARNHQDFLKEYGEELKYMALDIAERILRKEVQEDRHALEEMAVELVSEVRNAPWINVEVSEEVEGLADYLKERLNMAEQDKSIFVEAGEAPPDSLRIVTEEGVIDATISVQLKQLRDAFVAAEEEGD
ncbi:MAG: FliH/SctL family protein [Clostridiales bacterium]|nr:FliH/SctL family protein [Clostridiales bacterium]